VIAMLARLALLAAAATLLLAGPADAAGKRRALLVGIGDYQVIGDLAPKQPDIQAVERLLVDGWGFREDEIAVLYDAQATRANILASMRNWLVNSTGRGDWVVFYFSGHGSQVVDESGDEEDGYDETLCPWDTGSGAGPNDTQITDDDVAQVLAQLGGREVTFILDSCHSGTISRSFLPTDGAGQDLVRTPLWQPAGNAPPTQDAVRAYRGEEPFLRAEGAQAIWSAAAAYQYSWEQAGKGIFTHAFVDGVLRGTADLNGNGKVTNAELLDWVRGQTQSYCSQNPDCTLGFTPMLEAPSALLAAVVGPPGAVGPSPTPPAAGAPVTVEQVTEIIPPDPDPYVTLEILPAPKVKLGQEVQFKVTSGRSGWLVLLDVNAAGQVTQLFPNEISNRQQKNNRILASRPLLVPDAYYGVAFTATEPLGKGALIAISMEDEAVLADLLAEHADLAAIADGQAYLAELAKRLRQIWQADAANRALRWSMTEVTYEIVP